MGEIGKGKKAIELEWFGWFGWFGWFDDQDNK
jgi:hypothetical protein